MSAQSRFTTARAKLGSPIVWDNEEKRACAVFPRHWSDGDTIPEAADEAAMQKARICAQAFNRVHAELAWKQQQEGGKR